jgi:hypothetical protein
LSRDTFEGQCHASYRRSCNKKHQANGMSVDDVARMR